MKTRKKPYLSFKGKVILYPILLFISSFMGNLFLQVMQNHGSLSLAFKFAFSWHEVKFLLSTGVLMLVSLFISTLVGHFLGGTLLFHLGILLIGIATNLKMKYRQEPLYPDDLKMVTEVKLLKEMIPLPLFISSLLLVIAIVLLAGFLIYRSFSLSKKNQLIRVAFFFFSSGGLFFVGNFNQKGNLLKKAYDKTALWIPYSQKMNYYNVGFVAGFLYNLKVPAMTEPNNYSQKTMTNIIDKYQKQAAKENQKREARNPNIIFVMSESFSDPTRITGVNFNQDPLKTFRPLQKNYPSGKMLSSGYGGGTANIEFEALTGFSMALFNSQLTTPYTQLITKKKTFPSLVGYLKEKGYQTTAIHPYNTSMYKRKDVYQTFGFDTFLSEKDFSSEEKLQNNPYLPDHLAYDKILTLLEKQPTKQFIHLVTMQTHMPYGNKYPENEYHTNDLENKPEITNYGKDISYASEALNDFLTKLKQLPEETLVVFWGDHLPSIYPDEIVKQNPQETLHETEFLFFNNKKELKNAFTTPLSPFYFASELFQMNQLQTTPFYCFLEQLQKKLPAFEKGYYFKDHHYEKNFTPDEELKELYETYQLLQYDVSSGKKYSEKENFYQ